MTQPKKLFIKTYGCQMNVYDSERMAEALGGNGYVEVGSPDEADMILLNTCHIREKAAEKVYSELGRFKGLKAEKPDLKIGVAGCVAQAEGEEIMRRQPMVDLVVGPQSYHRLPEMEARAGAEKVIDTDFPEEDKFEKLKSRPKAKRGPTAFLTVQEGCDKFCAFCVVPYTRGAEVSRPVDRVLAEARDLVSRGVREITLLGQNVNAYHGEGPDGRDWTLARLIRELAEIDDLARIRFTTSHPNDMDDDLIAAHGDCVKLMPYLHLPVQSGSDKILKRMNRSHDRDSYLRLIERIRAARPDILMSGDFIVGFPEETEADFQATLDLIHHMIGDLGQWDSGLSLEDELRQTWAEDMIWWGPEGIGATYTIERYAKQHAGPFRAAFTDRSGTGHIARLAEGSYGGFFGWPNFTARPTGGFMGMPHSETLGAFRVIDIYRRSGTKLAENWVFIETKRRQTKRKCPDHALNICQRRAGCGEWRDSQQVMRQRLTQVRPISSAAW